MNPNTKNITILPCIVCAYPFSDWHHLFPQAQGGKRGPKINVCPNHHRYANIVQVMIAQGRPTQEIREFAGSMFDRRFNSGLLDALIEYAITGIVEILVGATT